MITVCSYKWGIGNPSRKADTHFSGISHSGDMVKEVVRDLVQYGHVVVETDSTGRSWNHHVIGVGVGHDDAHFAEVGSSMAAYYENGESWDGKRWWEDLDDVFSIGRDYYGVK